MNYLKLDREFTIKQYSRGNLQREYGIDSPLGFRGMRYYDVTVDGDIYEAIPDCDVDECNVSLLDINYKIPPHSDDVRLVINFYLNTTKCITQFYYPSDFHTSDTGDVIFYEPNLERRTIGSWHTLVMHTYWMFQLLMLYCHLNLVQSIVSVLV